MSREALQEQFNSFDFETSGGEIRLTGFHGKGRHVLIPEQIGGLPVRVIGTRTFYENGMYIEKITVPPSVRVVEPYAFELCVSLRELELSDGLEILGENCTLATEVEHLYIPKSVRKIGGLREMTCILKIDPENPWFQTDGYGLYQEERLLTVNPSDPREDYAIKEGTSSIRKGAFDNQPKLKKLHLPASMRNIPEGVLTNIREPFALETGIEEVTVDPENPLFAVEEGALYGLISEDDGKNSHTAGEDQAENLVLLRYAGKAEMITLPENLARIGEAACFRSGLKEIIIPESVTGIGPDAFALCPLEKAVLEFGGGGLPPTEIYFPQADSFLLKNLLAGFGVNGKRYDFSEYDRTLQEVHLNPDRVRMILSRLENPLELPAVLAKRIRMGVKARMKEIVFFIAENKDLDLLERLAGHGFITDQNIDRLIDAANDAGQHETLAWLMDYKHTHFSHKSFDFSL